MEISQNIGLDGSIITEFRNVLRSKANSLKNILTNSSYHFEKEIRRKIENLVEKLRELSEFRFEQLPEQLATSSINNTEMPFHSSIQETLDLVNEILQKLNLE